MSERSGKNPGKKKAGRPSCWTDAMFPADTPIEKLPPLDPNEVVDIPTVAINENDVIDFMGFRHDPNEKPLKDNS